MLMFWLALLAVAIAAPCTAAVGDARAVPPAAGLDGQAPVDFLEQAPVIDGRLDAGLLRLAKRTFPIVLREPVTNPTPDAHYRLAYGTGFLYVYVEASADSLTFRDRAYQNGDGFHMVIARPQPADGATDEFYVLACSAVREPRMEWSRRVFWYYNVDHLFVRTSDAARLEFAEGDGRIAFELLLPWADVHPWHPWLSEAVGFNLAFVKAMPDGKNMYMVVPDGRIDSEQSPRLYTRLQFVAPRLTGQAQAFVQLERGHVASGSALGGVAVVVASSDTLGPPAVPRLSLRVLAGEGSAESTQLVELAAGPGMTVQHFTLDAASLLPGGYRVQWRLDNGMSAGEAGLTILPRASPCALLQRLGVVADRGDAASAPSAGSIATVRYLIQDAEQQLSATKAYETCATARVQLELAQEAVNALEQGVDAIQLQRGLFRRAFVSQLDGSLQPYAVLVPADYDPARRTPLLVFLHGSGTDERALDSFRALVPDGWLAVAPRARGTSHAYATFEAQRDIVEAMDDVQANYAVDSTRVVLAGFSMGGYGVLRTQFEHPGRFQALVVVSGHPAIASKFGFGDDQPDFCDERRLASFRGLPVFLTHGQRDRNCPYDLAVQLVDRLRAAGATVAFVSDPVRGHEAPAPETLERLREWLRGVVGSD